MKVLAKMSFSEVQKRLTGWAAGSDFHEFRDYLGMHGVGVNYDRKRKFAVVYCRDRGKSNDFTRLLSGVVFSYAGGDYRVLARRTRISNRVASSAELSGEEGARVENAYTGTYLLGFRVDGKVVLSSAKCTDISRISPSGVDYASMLAEAFDGTGTLLEDVVPTTGYVELLLSHPLIFPFCKLPVVRVRNVADERGDPVRPDNLEGLWVRTFSEIPDLSCSLEDFKDCAVGKLNTSDLPDPVTTGVIVRAEGGDGVFVATPFNSEVEYITEVWGVNSRFRGVEVYKYRILHMHLEGREDLRELLPEYYRSMWDDVENAYTVLVGRMTNVLKRRDAAVQSADEMSLFHVLRNWVLSHDGVSVSRLSRKVDLFLRSASRIHVLLYKILFATSRNTK